MDWNAKTPSQWDYESLVLFNTNVGEVPRLAQPSQWGIENGSIYSSGGAVCSGSEVGNGCSSKSSLSASIDSAPRAGPRVSMINFDAASKDPDKKELGRVKDFRNTPELAGSVGEPLIGLKLGKRTYFEDFCTADDNKNLSFPAVPMPSSTVTKKTKVSHQSLQKSRCQVEGCNVDLTTAKSYHRKHRVCESHSKCPVVIVAGQERRFCQQCSRFHDLSEFDQKKRSCRRRLFNHNARRRKPLPHGISCNSARLSSSLYGLEASVIASNLDGAPDFRRALSLLSTESRGSATPGSTSINRLSHVNHASSSDQTAVQVVHPNSDYWHAEQSMPQEPRVCPFPLHSDGSQFQEFQLRKGPCGTAFLDSNYIN